MNFGVPIASRFPVFSHKPEPAIPHRAMPRSINRMSLASVLLLHLLCFGLSRSVTSFSFVAIHNRKPSPSSHHLHSKQEIVHSRRRSKSMPTARFSFLRNFRESEHEHRNDGDGIRGCFEEEEAPIQSRRRMVSSIVAGVLSSGVVTRHLKHAFALPTSAANAATIDTAKASAIGTADHPVVIVGGAGRTGMAVAETMADPRFGNMDTVTLSRSGRDPFQIVKLPQATKEHLRHNDAPFDVREPQETISASLKALSPSVVVYAASASRQGGNAADVDDFGVEKVALACRDIGAIFVLISAMAVDRPDSKSFQITNTLGGSLQGIMDAKYNGEVKTRKIFQSAKTEYVIIRPGVLLNGKSTAGPVGLELNQGDTIGGGLSRDELAGIVVGAIQSRNLAKKNGGKGGGITVEAYRKATAQKLEKQYAIPSGNELSIDPSKAAASSSFGLYQEFFIGAKPD